VGQEAPRGKVTDLVEELLVGRPLVSEATLQGPWAQPEPLGDLLHGRALAADLPGEDRAHVVEEGARRLSFLEGGLEPWQEQRHELRVLRDERSRKHVLLEDEGVGGRVEPYLAPEVRTQHALVGTTTRKLETARPDRGARPASREIEHAGEDAVDERRRGGP